MGKDTGIRHAFPFFAQALFRQLFYALALPLWEILCTFARHRFFLDPCGRIVASAAKIFMRLNILRRNPETPLRIVAMAADSEVIAAVNEKGVMCTYSSDSLAKIGSYDLGVTDIHSAEIFQDSIILCSLSRGVFRVNRKTLRVRLEEKPGAWAVHHAEEKTLEIISREEGGGDVYLNGRLFFSSAVPVFAGCLGTASVILGVPSQVLVISDGRKNQKKEEAPGVVLRRYLLRSPEERWGSRSPAPSTQQNSAVAPINPTHIVQVLEEEYAVATVSGEIFIINTAVGDVQQVIRVRESSINRLAVVGEIIYATGADSRIISYKKSESGRYMKHVQIDTHVADVFGMAAVGQKIITAGADGVINIQILPKVGGGRFECIRRYESSCARSGSMLKTEIRQENISALGNTVPEKDAEVSRIRGQGSTEYPHTPQNAGDTANAPGPLLVLEKRKDGKFLIFPDSANESAPPVLDIEVLSGRVVSRTRHGLEIRRLFLNPDGEPEIDHRPHQIVRGTVHAYKLFSNNCIWSITQREDTNWLEKINLEKSGGAAKVDDGIETPVCAIRIDEDEVPFKIAEGKNGDVITCNRKEVIIFRAGKGVVHRMDAQTSEVFQNVFWSSLTGIITVTKAISPEIKHSSLIRTFSDANHSADAPAPHISSDSSYSDTVQRTHKVPIMFCDFLFVAGSDIIAGDQKKAAIIPEAGSLKYLELGASLESLVLENENLLASHCPWMLKRQTLPPQVFKPKFGRR